ncbi:MAG: hypothetical protein H0W67_10265 [Gemmatimonadales bacterium]|nr:hypothetical protein [Gemmatimonadales bacterium]
MAVRRQALTRWWRSLALFIPIVSGWAAGAPRTEPSAPAHATIGAPQQTIPAPVHDESTCAFCQAAAFPPLAAARSAVVPLALSSLEIEPVAPGDESPVLRFTHRPSSRAPPVLQPV